MCEAQHDFVIIFEELFSAIAPIKRNDNGYAMRGISGIQGASSSSSSCSSSSIYDMMSIDSISDKSNVNSLTSDQFTSAKSCRIG